MTKQEKAERDKVIIESCLRGEIYRDIAKKFVMTPSNVHYMLKRHGIDLKRAQRTGAPKGMCRNHHTRKATSSNLCSECNVANIKRLRKLKEDRAPKLTAGEQKIRDRYKNYDPTQDFISGNEIQGILFSFIKPSRKPNMSRYIWR